MCGLVGLVSSGIGKMDIDKFSTLMLFSSTRGKHSTGVIGVATDYAYMKNGTNDYYYLKSAVQPSDFCDLPEFHTMATKPAVRALLGHTRYATRGLVNTANAHPFVSQSQNIIGMHNGTINGKYKGQDDYETDSEALINILDEEGVEGLKGLWGAYALIWYDVKANTVNFIRNSERTLHFTKHMGDVFYASEPWMLRAMAEKHSYTGNTEIKVESLPPYHHMVIDFKKNNYREDIDITLVKDLEVKTVSAGSRFRGGYYSGLDWQEDAFWNEADSQFQRPLERKDEGKKEDTKGDENRLLPFIPSRPSPTGGVAHPLSERAKSILEASKGTRKGNATDLVRDHKGRFVPTSKSLSGDDDVDVQQHFLKGIHERQYVDSDSGYLFIETYENEWLEEDDFMEAAVHEPCFICGKFKEITEKRSWMSREEFICETCYDGPRPVIMN